MQVTNQHPPRADLTAYLDPIFHECCANAAQIAVAVSGGPDSMALAILAKAWCDRHRKQFMALTVDHGLREESAAEAKQVAAWMQLRKIAHTTLTPAPLPKINNLQARARAMRYGTLTEFCRTHDIGVLLLAHHYDDQAETVALQQHRGTSSPSRAGMPLVSLRDGISLARPLLGVRKIQLIGFLETMGVAWLNDPSNATDRFARNRLRRTLNDEQRHALWREAQQQGATRYGEDLTRHAWFMHHAHAEGNALLLDRESWYALADAMRTDVLSRAIQAVGGKPYRPRAHETQRLDQELRSKISGKATLGHTIVTWNAASITMVPEQPLDATASTPHMKGMNPLKRLAKPAFWWFNYEPF